MSSDDLITVTRKKGGRPVGSKTMNSPQAIAKAFGPMARDNVRKMLEKGDLDVTMKVFHYAYGKQAPLQPITLGKIRNAEEAKLALEQLIAITASGQITLDHAEKLQGMINKYLEVTEVDQLKKRLEAIEQGQDNE